MQFRSLHCPECAERGQQRAYYQLQGAARNALDGSSGKRARAADDHECDGRRQGRAGERPRGGAERDDDYRDFQTLEHYTAKRQ